MCSEVASGYNTHEGKPFGRTTFHCKINVYMYLYNMVNEQNEHRLLCFLKCQFVKETSLYTVA